MINVKDFDLHFLKIDKKLCKNIDICYIGYKTIKDFDYVRINSVNPLNIFIGKADGYVEEKSENKYLIFTSTDKRKKVLTKYKEIWHEVKYLIKTINDEKE